MKMWILLMLNLHGFILKIYMKFNHPECNNDDLADHPATTEKPHKVRKFNSISAVNVMNLVMLEMYIQVQHLQPWHLPFEFLTDNGGNLKLICKYNVSIFVVSCMSFVYLTINLIYLFMYSVFVIEILTNIIYFESSLNLRDYMKTYL